MIQLRRSKQLSSVTPLALMRAVILSLCALASHSALATGLTYVDADVFNPPNLEPASSIIFTAVSNDNFWGRRTGFGAADLGGTQMLWESGFAEDSPMLTQTISGLTPGASYEFYAVYWSNPNSPQDWRIQTGVDSSQLKTYNHLGPTANLPNATAGQLAGAGVWTSPPLSAGGTPLFFATNLRMYLGHAGTAVANDFGQAAVYIDDVPFSGANFRTWFDGVAYAPAGAPVFLTASIDRDTGSLVVANPTAQDFTIKSYSVTSASGAIDATQWSPITGNLDGAGTGAFDSNPWAITQPANPATTPFATSIAEGATVGSGGVLAASGGELALDNVWARTPFQDLVVSLTLGDNSVVIISPTYTGAPHTVGDFNGNGSIDAADYLTLMTNLHVDLSTLTLAERYTLGDFSRNGVVDYQDFIRFAGAYDLEHGAGAFAAMAQTVPEPASILLGMFGFLAMVVVGQWRLSQRFALKAAMAGCVSLACANLSAAPVVNWQLDPSFGGGLNGTTILTGADTNSPTVGDGVVVNNAANVGMFAEIPQASISAGQQITFSGALNINGITGTLAGEFRIGVFQENGDPPDTFGWLGMIAQHSSGEDTGSLVSRNPNGTNFQGVHSFSTLAGRATTLAIGGNSAALTSGDYQFQMTIGRFDDNTVTAHATLVSANGYSLELYRATETDPQRITFDFNRVGFLLGGVLDANQILFNNLDASVEAIVAPTLQVSSSGNVSLVNTSGAPLDLKYYEITSASGALSVGGWTSIDSTEGPGPVTSGWQEALGSTAFILSEGNLEGSTTVASNGSIALGSAFQSGAAQDLRFFYALADGSIYRGLVEYVSTATPGDFNGDGNVDGADFVIWQTNFPNNTGTATLATGDANGDGNVDGADFVIWQTNFPTIAGSVAAVPEPSAALLALVAVSLVGLRPLTRRKSAS